ncbi:MAG: hypothetical protein HY764_04860 [Candidatus Portnoybacteria bacterium]|nr:hypothetical protein [Candidatus Portnoybacteria bacterium]
MSISAFIACVIVGLIILLIVSLLWQAGKLRRPTGAATTTTKKLIWTPSRQAIAVIILLLIAVFIIFSTQVRAMPGWALGAFAVVIGILFFGGDPKRTISLGRFVAWVIIIVFLSIFIFYPAAEKKMPKHWFASTQKTEWPIVIERPRITEGQKSEQKITVVLHPDRWSRLIDLPAGTNYYFEGPDGATIKREVDGLVVPVTYEFGVARENRKGFRFMGPEGEKVTITVVQRTGLRY